MQSIRYWLRKYPMHIKYGLMIINIFIMIGAVKIYINYATIEESIDESINENMK